MAVSFSYNNPSIKKSVAQYFDMLEVSKFPLFQELKEGQKPTNIYHFWDEDKDDAIADKSAVEGATWSAGAGTDPTQPFNVCQYMKDDIEVTESHEATVPSSSIRKPFEQRMYKAMRAVKYSGEDALLNSSLVSGNDTVARRMKGITSWITTNTTAASNLSLTASVMDDFLDAVWTSSNDDVDTAWTTATLKRKFLDTTRFAGVTRNVDAIKGQIVNTVSVYVGSNDKPIKVRRHPLMGSGKMVIMKTSCFKKSYLLRPGVVKYGGSVNPKSAARFRLDMTLEAHNEESNYYVSQGLL